MFQNERKTIGLFIFNPKGDFQGEVCRAMAVRAEQLGYNLAVFSSYGAYGTDGSGYETGEMMIYDLPDYDKFDGIVLALDTFSIEGARKKVLRSIEKYSSCPVVSLREPMEGFHNILIREENSMEKITRHVIETHGKKDIAFMTGVKGREDAEKRLSCFKKVMAEYGYPVGEHRVFYGDFWKGKGKEACDWFSSDGTYPEAILCANDYMALSVIDELFERGLRVPEDVIVTGYDGLEEGVYYNPSLTTVHVNFEDMAYKAVDLIERHQQDDEVETLYAELETVPRVSCGCELSDNTTAAARRCSLHKAMTEGDNVDMQFSFMTIDLSGVKSIGKLHEVISKYIYNVEGFENYYVCLREDIAFTGNALSDSGHEGTIHRGTAPVGRESKSEAGTGYTDKMHIRAAIQHREDLGEVDIAFDRHMLLPKELIDDTPQCYYFVPIHYRDNGYGYEAYSFGGRKRYGKTYVRWNISISNAIYNIISYNRMNDLIFELENMYIQDTLTGLYNRRGFEKCAGEQFYQAKRKERMVCVVGIDMDGLKPINDIYGHHEGDSALCVVGYAIKEAVVPGQIGARIGGDEFEVIFPCGSEADVRRWVETFERSLDTYNKKSGKSYEVHASLGYRAGIPAADDTLAGYMKESDDIMYKNKLENKRKRNELLR